MNHNHLPHPLSGNVAAIEAHADDAAVMLSSALFEAASRGATLHGVTATNGQWADKRRNLADVVSGRRAEAQRGWSDLGISPERQAHLPFEDGTLSRPANVLQFGKFLTRYALRHNLNTLVTLGDFGGDAHPDHIASHHAALVAQRRIQQYRDEPLVVMGLSEHVGDLEVRVDPGRKLRMLAHYASQFDILPSTDAPANWSRINGHAVSPDSRRELEIYSSELFEAEHYVIHA